MLGNDKSLSAITDSTVNTNGDLPGKMSSSSSNEELGNGKRAAVTEQQVNSEDLPPAKRPSRLLKDRFPADPLEYVPKPWIGKVLAGVPSDCLPSFCFGKLDALDRNFIHTSYPIQKSRAFKIGSSTSTQPGLSVDVRIDEGWMVGSKKSGSSVEVGEVHVIIMYGSFHESKGGNVFKISNNTLSYNENNVSSVVGKRAASTPKVPPPKAAVQEVKEAAVPTYTSARLRNASLAAAASAAAEETALKSAAAAASLEAEISENMKIDCSANVKETTSSSESLPNAIKSESSLLNLPPNPFRSTFQSNWYMQVVGKTGLYLNNYYHGPSLVNGAGDDEEGGVGGKGLVPLKEGDRLVIGDWTATLHFYC